MNELEDMVEVPQMTYKSEDEENRAKRLYGSWYQESKYEVLNSIRPLCFRSSGGMIFILQVACDCEFGNND